MEQTLQNLNKFICVYHQKPIQIIDLDISKNSNILKCVKCITESQQSINLITLEEIIQSDKDTILGNWPPYNNYYFSQQVAQFIKEQINLNSQMEQIFDNFTTQVIQAIQQKKKLVLQKIENVVRSKQELEEIFKYNFSINQLQECFKDQCDMKSLEKKIRDVIFYYQKNKDIKDYIINQMNQIKKEIKEFDLEYSNKSTSLLIETIQNFEIFNDNIPLIQQMNNQLKQEKQLIENNQNEKRQQDLQNNSFKVDKLIQLIDNQFNYCNNDFIKQLRNKFSFNCSWLEEISFANIQQPHFSQAQIFDKRLDELKKQTELQRQLQFNLIKSLGNSLAPRSEEDICLIALPLRQNIQISLKFSREKSNVFEFQINQAESNSFVSNFRFNYDQIIQKINKSVFQQQSNNITNIQQYQSTLVGQQQLNNTFLNQKPISDQNNQVEFTNQQNQLAKIKLKDAIQKYTTTDNEGNIYFILYLSNLNQIYNPNSNNNNNLTRSQIYIYIVRNNNNSAQNNVREQDQQIPKLVSLYNFLDLENNQNNYLAISEYKKKQRKIIEII